MPTYTRPEWVHVEPGRGVPVVALIVLAVIGYAAYQVAEWLASVLVAIEAGAGVVAAGALTVLAVVLRRQRGRQHLDAPQWVVERFVPSHGTIPVRPAAAVTTARRPAIEAAPQPVIEAPAVHYHLHLHAPATAQPAIEEKQ